jgi:Predicted ATPase (AAA+ superfamily)
VVKRLEGLVDRRLLGVALTRLQDEPVLALQGPRTVGKSTLLNALAGARGGVLVDLDDLATREAVAADPAAFLSESAIVCIDEYQHVPEILDAVKAELNRDLRPGRFVLTGSTRHDALPAVARALTGRIHLVTVLPLSQVELAGTAGNALGELLRGEPFAGGAASLTTREEYVDRVVAGGLPLALARGEAARLRWFDDYVRLSLERGSAEVTRVRQPAQLQGLLERLAGQTGQVLNVAAAAHAVGMDERTADHYLSLLEAVFLVQRLPAWGTRFVPRAGSSPKIQCSTAAWPPACCG